MKRKNSENRTANELTRNIFAARFSFGVLASLNFIICNIVLHKHK